jgi:diguanylate cyclase (GGDEF)-like protein
MNSIRLLSEAIIETLKEFSSEKRTLTVDTLCDALTRREEIYSLLHDAPSAAPDPSGAVPAENRPQQPDSLPSFRQVLDTFKMVLSSIESISREEHTERLSEVRRRLDECHTLESLAGQSAGILAAVTSIVGRSVEEIEFTNDFLIELGENLSTMEGQLFSYQSHNRETYELHGQFCDNLLSQTQQMDQAVVFARALEDARNIISSRLALIGKAIQMKRQEDEVRLKKADSTIAELQMSVRNYNKEITLVTQRAIELEKEVLLDPLLQINNRRSYDLKIEETIRNYHRTGLPFSLILIDVDHFKAVNDQFGHRAGDKCLQELAKLVENSVRKTDFVARYGGEELIAILPGSIVEDARNIAEKIRDRIDKTRFYYQDQVISLTISLGVTQARFADTDAEKLFVRVDEAMYHSKRNGRNRVSVV